MAWDEGLRPRQRDVAGAPRGDMVLLAGPGTGKTHVLTRRIEHLISIGVAPQTILALTFTRAAAASMRERVDARTAAVRRVRISTLHSYALRELLREGAKQLPTPVRVVDDWEERWVVVEELARFLSRTTREIWNTKGTGALNRLADDWDVLAVDDEGWEERFADPRFLAAWRQHREVYGYTLRAELVYQLLCELRSNPSFSPSDAETVLVDEYQDLNHCELETIRFLTRRAGAEIFAAGDDDQSIYRFRHAHPAGIRNFYSHYPNARKRVLTECMRCGPDIVRLANWLIAHDVRREPKELVSVTEWRGEVRLIRFGNQHSESAGIATMVKAEVDAGCEPHEILILVKSDLHNRISDALAQALDPLGIRMYRPRARSDESIDVQRILEFLTLAAALEEHGRVDELALRALLELENNRIGSERLWRITRLALDRSLKFSEAISYAEAHPQEFATGQFARVVAERDRICAIARQLAPEEDERFQVWLARVATLLSVELDDLTVLIDAAEPVSAEVADIKSDQEQRENGEGELEDGVAQESAGTPSVTNYVLSLRAALTHLSDTLPAHLTDHVTFTTMHGAKGLTADVVFILQAEDEVIPGEAQGPELDEARRLFYVSITRARKRLVITACQRRTGPQRFVAAREEIQRSLSRFVRDYKLTATTVSGYIEALGNEQH